jgi:hypothetical protein
LHCRVIGIADLGLLYIKHIPLSGNQPAEDDFLLSADLIPCSDSAIYNDSVLIYYKVDNGSYEVANMTNTGGFHYTGIIPKQPAGSIISYYLYAADKSGRHATCPFIGPGDPFTFTAVYTDLAAVPDTLRFDTYDDCINGKYTAIHNYTTAPIDLTSVETMGWFSPGPTGWSVETSLPPLPHSINPGDSLQFRVIILIPTTETYFGYWIDTLHFSSPADTHNVIVLLNDTLVIGMRNHPGIADPFRVNVYPNPGHDYTTLAFKLDEPENVKLEIIDLNGRKVKNLIEGSLGSGVQTIRWDLMSDGHTRVRNGIYFYRLTTEKVSIHGRIIVY